MKKTKIGNASKVQTRDRLCDSIGVTLRDIIVKDLLTDSEKKLYYPKEKAEQFELFNIYIDKYEKDPDVSFNFSINGEPAESICYAFEMFTLSGNNNESGNEPQRTLGTFKTGSADTIVSFKMPIDPELNTFSEHANGKSYANYVVYGVVSQENKPRIMLGKGKIYMTDVLFDLTENILDGQ